MLSRDGKFLEMVLCFFILMNCCHETISLSPPLCYFVIFMNSLFIFKLVGVNMICLFAPDGFYLNEMDVVATTVFVT